MAAVAQYVTIVDKSNKVVGTTKQLKNVFKEAKTAYLERKAEIHAERKAKEEHELNKARRHLESLTIAQSDAGSRASSRSRRHDSHGRRDGDRRPRVHERHHSSASVRSGYSRRSSVDSSHHDSRSPSRSPRSQHTSLGHFNDQLQNTRSAGRSPLSPRRPSHELVRRQTENLALVNHHPKPLTRSRTDHDIDMDLAYGDYHPDAFGLTLDPAVEEKLQKQELSSLVTKCKMLLDEANCAQHSVKAIVQHLQKNPDAMAAVALTLAEISNIASKMAPGALAMMKGTAPTVFAMLAAPEFLIAVGVGVGITVVMFGGYKIIKKIRAKVANQEGESMDEALEIGELDRIEHWRRGIADAETASVVSHATSVEGEFITPIAARSMGHLPQIKEQKSRSKKEKKEKEKKEKKHKHKSDKAGSEPGSHLSRGTSRSEKLELPGSAKDKALIKVKKPSPLRSMFRSKDTNSASSVA